MSGCFVTTALFLRDDLDPKTVYQIGEELGVLSSGISKKFITEKLAVRNQEKWNTTRDQRIRPRRSVNEGRLAANNDRSEPRNLDPSTVIDLPAKENSGNQSTGPQTPGSFAALPHPIIKNP